MSCTTHPSPRLVYVSCNPNAIGTNLTEFVFMLDIDDAFPHAVQPVPGRVKAVCRDSISNRRGNTRGHVPANTALRVGATAATTLANVSSAMPNHDINTTTRLFFNLNSASLKNTSKGPRLAAHSSSTCLKSTCVWLYVKDWRRKVT